MFKNGNSYYWSFEYKFVIEVSDEAIYVVGKDDYNTENVKPLTDNDKIVCSELGLATFE